MKDNPFQFLVNEAMKLPGRTHMRPVIEKELLHYDILFILDNENLLDALTFQGGTALRLCYGAQRFSEDLDFAGGIDFNRKDLMKIKTCLSDYLESRYHLEVNIKEPQELSTFSENHGLQVSKWQIRVTKQPERPDLPKQIIKIEVANVPAYTREVRQLQHHYEFLPDGYGDILVIAEKLDEILADKLLAFVNSRKYIRYRDVWDFRWLIQQGAQLQISLLLQKIQDYNVTDYEMKLDEVISQLSSIIHGKEFKSQISRFLPLDAQERTLQKEKFYSFLTSEVTDLLLNVKKQLT